MSEVEQSGRVIQGIDDKAGAEHKVSTANKYKYMESERDFVWANKV